MPEDLRGEAVGARQGSPAVGQGAIAIETRVDDELVVSAVKKLDHHETRVACLAERELLRSLGGGCQFPIAAHAIVKNDRLQLEALVAKPDGSHLIRDQINGSIERPEEVGKALAAKLLAAGAGSLLSEFLK